MVIHHRRTTGPFGSDLFARLMVDILLSKDSDELIELKYFSWERVDWQTKNSSTLSYFAKHDFGGVVFKSLNEMKYFIFVLIFIVSGCSSTQPTILPEKSDLNVATVNHNYQDVIEIKGGAVNESSVSVRIIPNDSGLAWNPEETKYSFGGEDGVNKDYHRIIISGIPKKSGEYCVIVSGFTLGTMYSGQDFYKQYKLKIE